MINHTKEPWRVAKCCDGIYAGFHCLVVAGGKEVVGVRQLGYPQNEEIEYNAQRIVDCVNACAGINPAAVPDLLAACEVALAALEDIRQGKAVPGTGVFVRVDLERAIAKARQP